MPLGLAAVLSWRRALRRVANGPSWGQVAEYPLIYLLDLRRSGWQVQGASRQESAGKSWRGGKIRSGQDFAPGIVLDSEFPGLDDASIGPARETSHSSRKEENRATEPDHYRCVPDRPHPCECCHRAQSNSDLEQGNAVGKSVMLMHQMVGLG